MLKSGQLKNGTFFLPIFKRKNFYFGESMVNIYGYYVVYVIDHYTIIRDLKEI